MKHSWLALLTAQVLVGAVVAAGAQPQDSGFVVERTVQVSDAIPSITVTNTSGHALVLDSVRLVAPLDSVAAGDTAVLSLAGETSSFRYDLIGNRAPSPAVLSVEADSSARYSIFPYLEFWNTEIVLVFHSQDRRDTLDVTLQAPMRAHPAFAEHGRNTGCVRPQASYNALGQRQHEVRSSRTFRVLSTSASMWNTHASTSVP